ncbi:hypothetical protein M422DRAFT_273500 [Sphaerobolus stellatus SS14]|uniref:Uncharacterized protein n=1 Tax=Sphaerobolus stellatus (strain SS14) TaxID=990650 RepID=A0A0C9UJG5_SPHS4|nr:hypothetical protein M422DRAFT_273500 [Sphaerobolus stellatus SS14]
MGTKNFQSVILRHSEHVQNLIPTNKLLIYDIAEGWKPLADIFEIDIPALPFPHVNDTKSYGRDRNLHTE